eukprot:TRINITY_DN4547_c0_g1_i5.p1 TRINITY_DN4547_c0_g1~~TRINITY_DN4547_c0_g1_i5.p1  ORF type:complete len:126 (-),score=3.36 TRINITY_DN4547_c0_g1_i5:83-460(-)
MGSTPFAAIMPCFGPLAQLVRADGSQPSGRRFESCKVHENNISLWRITQVRLKGTVLKTVRRVKARKGSNPLSSFSGLRPLYHYQYYYRGVEQLAARRAHNPEVTGSSPVPAIVMIVAASAACKP